MAEEKYLVEDAIGKGESATIIVSVVSGVPLGLAALVKPVHSCMFYARNFSILLVTLFIEDRILHSTSVARPRSFVEMQLAMLSCLPGLVMPGTVFDFSMTFE